MPRYVDGFVIPIKKGKLPAYRRLAAKCGKVWMEHGALAYLETAGEDLKAPCGLPFPRLTKVRPGETVLLSFIIYRSRRHRDAVNKKVMADPRLQSMMGTQDMPFDVKRMAYGGFAALVDL